MRVIAKGHLNRHAMNAGGSRRVARSLSGGQQLGQLGEMIDHRIGFGIARLRIEALGSFVLQGAHHLHAQSLSPLHIGQPIVADIQRVPRLDVQRLQAGLEWQRMRLHPPHIGRNHHLAEEPGQAELAQTRADGLGIRIVGHQSQHEALLQSGQQFVHVVGRYDGLHHGVEAYFDELRDLVAARIASVKLLDQPGSHFTQVSLAQTVAVRSHPVRITDLPDLRSIQRSKQRFQAVGQADVAGGHLRMRELDQGVAVIEQNGPYRGDI